MHIMATHRRGRRVIRVTLTKEAPIISPVEPVVVAGADYWPLLLEVTPEGQTLLLEALQDDGMPASVTLESEPRPGGPAVADGGNVYTGLYERSAQVAALLAATRLTRTDGAQAAGAAFTSLPIVAIGGAATRKRGFTGDTAFVVGSTVLHTLTLTADVDGNDTALAVASYTPDEDIPDGAAVLILNRQHQDNAIRGVPTLTFSTTPLAGADLGSGALGEEVIVYLTNANPVVTHSAAAGGILLASGEDLKPRQYSALVFRHDGTNWRDKGAASLVQRPTHVRAGASPATAAADGRVVAQEDLYTEAQKPATNTEIVQITTLGKLEKTGVQNSRMVRRTGGDLTDDKLVAGSTSGSGSTVKTTTITSTDVVTSGVNLTTDKFVLGAANNRTAKAGTTGPADYYTAAQTDTAIAAAVAGAGDVTTPDSDLSGLLVGAGGKTIDDTGIDPNDVLVFVTDDATAFAADGRLRVSIGGTEYYIPFENV
jgi:hypothetical protein